ncbi:MAG: hypothetical protein ACH346_01805 [Chthoniobacterales bacterium]
MITSQIGPEKVMTINWSLEDGITTDLNDFIRATTIQENAVPVSGVCSIQGERSVSFLEWRSLLSSLTTLLDHGVPMKFSCTSKKIYDWILYLGFALLGEVFLDQESFL